MRQLYIEEKKHGIRRTTLTGLYCLNKIICANCSISMLILLQNAESLCFSKKLFLIRSALSGLAVTLPNMDRMAGGELE